MASQNNGNKQDNTPDEEIFGIFSEVFNAMDISRADIAWILVKRDDAVWLSLRKKRINTSD